MGGDQLKGICSVCFGPFVLHKDKPKRHGFNVITNGRGQGHLGAWHTGPCMGWDYEHFGLSCEGTRAAEAAARRALGAARQELKRLKGKPDLQWRRPPTRAERRTGMQMDEAVTVCKGDKDDYKTGRPSYDSLWTDHVAKVQARIEAIGRAIKTYVEAIRTWKPAEPVAVKPRGAILHLDSHWKGRAEVRVPACQAYAMQPSFAATTKDANEVTCTRCRKRLEKAAAKAAAKEARRCRE